MTASTLHDMGELEPDAELAIEVQVGEQVRFRLPEASFGGYRWYLSELLGGSVMLDLSRVSAGKPTNLCQVNLFAFGPTGSSRFRLREARPFSPQQAAHTFTMQVSVSAHR